MARWLPIFAWCLCATSAVLIIILNLAGTNVTVGQHPALDHVLLGKYAPFSVTLPFSEVNSGTPFILRIYLNGACYYPMRIIEEETGPVCLPASVGRTTHLEPLVLLADETANSGYHYENNSNVTVENVHMHPFGGTVVPFVFYILGLFEMVLMLLSIPIVFCAENFAVVFHVAVSTGAFLSIMIGNAILIAMARSRIHELEGNSSKPYIEDAEVTGGFLGAGWGAACAALLAGVLLMFDWRYEVKLTGRRWREIVRVKRRVRRSRNRPRGGPTWRASTALHSREPQRNRTQGNLSPSGSRTISQDQLPSYQESQRQI